MIVLDAIDFLLSAGLAVDTAPPRELSAASQLFIERVSGLQGRTRDAVCWFNGESLAAIPGEEGWGLLLARVGDVDARGLVVACHDPRVALAELVARYFPPGDTWSGGAAAEVHATAILAPGVVLGCDVTIGAHSRIGPNTVLAHVTIGEGVEIGANCSVGLPGFGYVRREDGSWLRFPHAGRVLIGDDVSIGSNSCIDRGSLSDTIIRKGAKVDNLVHVAHNVEIGEQAIVIAQSMLGGSAVIGANAWLSPAVSVLNKLTIGENSLVGMGSVVIKDVAPRSVVVGNPAKFLRFRESD